MRTTSEYDAFGPWIDEVHTVSDLPRLYRDSGIDPAAHRLVLKVPRDIERRNATPDMHLYDYLLAVGGQGLTVLARRGDGYEGNSIPFEQIVAIEDSVSLLDGRLTVHTGNGGQVSIPYNGSANAPVRDLIGLLRQLYLPLPPVPTPSVTPATTEPMAPIPASPMAPYAASPMAPSPASLMAPYAAPPMTPYATSPMTPYAASPMAPYAASPMTTPSPAYAASPMAPYAAPPANSAATPGGTPGTVPGGTPDVTPGVMPGDTPGVMPGDTPGGTPDVMPGGAQGTTPAPALPGTGRHVPPVLDYADLGLYSAYRELVQRDPRARLVTATTRRVVAPASGSLRHVFQRLWPVILHASIVVADDREIQVLHRRHWFTRSNATVYSLAQTILPRSRISGVQVWPHERYRDVQAVVVHAGAAQLCFFVPAGPESHPFLALLGA